MRETAAWAGRFLSSVSFERSSALAGSADLAIARITVLTRSSLACRPPIRRLAKCHKEAEWHVEPGRRSSLPESIVKVSFVPIFLDCCRTDESLHRSRLLHAALLRGAEYTLRGAFLFAAFGCGMVGMGFGAVKRAIASCKMSRSSG